MLGPTRRDRGAAAVEFALVLPVLLLILFGIIDFGRMLNAQLTVNEAAREGARAMALQSESAGIDRVGTATEHRGGFSYVIVQSCPDPPGPNDDAIMQVSYDFSYITPLGAVASLIGATGNYSNRPLTSQGVMPCLQR